MVELISAGLNTELKFHAHFTAAVLVSLKFTATGAPQLPVMVAIKSLGTGVCFTTIILLTESLQLPKLLTSLIVWLPVLLNV